MASATSRSLLRCVQACSTLVLLAGSSQAEPIRFANDGALVWSPGGRFEIFPQVDPCLPDNPDPAYRAFDITRGPEQMSPLSPYPPPSSAFCRRGAHQFSTSGDSVPRYIVTSGNAGWATGGTLHPVGLAYGQSPTTLAPFAPGMVVGPSSAFAGNPMYCENPLTLAGPFRPDLWMLAPRQFVGVRFDLPDGIHYGWILLDRTSGELVPVEWAYETSPNTPIPILSTQTFSPVLATFTGQFSKVALRSGNTSAGLHDPAVHRLLGPTTGPFSLPFTPTDFANARAGAEAFSVNSRADWAQSSSPLWTSTTSSGSVERTALFAFDFTLPADFDPAFRSLRFDATFASADRIGPDNSSTPGLYLNGTGLAGSNGFSAPNPVAVRNFVDLQSLAHPGVNTLYVYNVAYGSSPPYAGGSGILVAGEFTVETLSPPAISIYPASAALTPSESFQFYGGVLDPFSNAVIWSASGGLVSQSGLYTAPSAAGTYTVRITSVHAPSAFVEALITVSPSCVPDFNADGNLDPDDLGDYITCFFTEPPCPGADFNHDADVNPDDLGDFITAFFLGC